MRKLFGFVVPAMFLFVVGCGGGENAPIGGGGATDGGHSLDGHTEQNPGAVGSSCQTACDCMPGLSCNGGTCGNGGAASYCCSSTSCPSGSQCQNESGSLSVCGGGSGGAPDLGQPGGGGLPFDLGLPGGGGGGGGLCAIVPCTSDADCSGGIGALLGCMTCDTTAGTCK